MFFVGLDLGQRQAYTAISVVERIDPQSPGNPHGALRGGVFDLADDVHPSLYGIAGWSWMRPASAGP